MLRVGSGQTLSAPAMPPDYPRMTRLRASPYCLIQQQQQQQQQQPFPRARHSSQVKTLCHPPSTSQPAHGKDCRLWAVLDANPWSDACIKRPQRNVSGGTSQGGQVQAQARSYTGLAT